MPWFVSVSDGFIRTADRAPAGAVALQNSARSIVRQPLTAVKIPKLRQRVHALPMGWLDKIRRSHKTLRRRSPSGPHEALSGNA
jgi:hypothetical protein